MSTTLHLVSWNLHGAPLAPRTRERLFAVTRELKARAPEVILLQEVWFSGDLRLIDRTLIGWSRTGPEGTERKLLRRGGLATYIRDDSPWTLVHASARFTEFGVEAPSWKFWEGDGIADKGFESVRLRNHRSDQMLVVANTHLQSQYGTDVRYVDVRRSQLRALGELARRAGEAPLILVGDFNSTVDEPSAPEMPNPYAEFTAAWTDLTANLRDSCRCGTHLDREGEGAWIDYIFARLHPSWAVTGRTALIRNRSSDDPFSDHHGLEAWIEISPASGALLPFMVWFAVAGTQRLSRRQSLLGAALALGELAGRSLLRIFN